VSESYSRSHATSPIRPVADDEVSVPSPTVSSNGVPWVQTSERSYASETNVEFDGVSRSVSAAQSRPSWRPSAVESSV
jgi:hypothetical protein